MVELQEEGNRQLHLLIIHKEVGKDGTEIGAGVGHLPLHLMLLIRKISNVGKAVRRVCLKGKLNLNMKR